MINTLFTNYKNEVACTIYNLQTTVEMFFSKKSVGACMLSN